MKKLLSLVTLALIIGAAGSLIPSEARAQSSGEAVVIVLNEQSASGQTGVAVLSAVGAQTQVTLTLLEGAMLTGSVHIHSGSCGPDQLGGVVYPLTSFVGGAGTSETTVDADLESLRTGNFAINTHRSGAGGTYTTCGNIPVEADSVTIALGEQNSSGQTGWASLTTRGGGTEVALWVGEGTVESELVHIHSGSCGNDTLGGVVHGLTSIASGISASMVDATLSSLRAGGMAVNSHQSGSPGTYTTCGNIPPGASDATLIALAEQNSSGQSGWASLTARGDQTVVLLSLGEGTMQTELVHIHTGTCGDNLGGVAHGLTSFVGGSGFSAKVVDASLSSLRSGGFAINSHRSGSPGTYTSCGNIPKASDTVTIALREQSSSGQSGWATLTSRGAVTEVVLSQAPGALESESVHIHNGSCGNSLGGVAYGLTKISGRASASTVSAGLEGLRTGQFAINSHKKGEGGVYTTCGNIPVSLQGVSNIGTMVALPATGDTGLDRLALATLLLGFGLFAGGAALVRGLRRAG